MSTVHLAGFLLCVQESASPRQESGNNTARLYSILAIVQ